MNIRTLATSTLFLLLLLFFPPSLHAQSFRVLVFSETAGFRHGSIPDGIALVQQLGADHDFGVDATEDSSVFSEANLANYRVVVFLNTTRNVLNGAEQTAFEAWVRGGGGYVGVHAASDTEYSWPFYGELVGGDAWFDSHPAIQSATVNKEQEHRSTSHLPASFSFVDEWYNFRANPRPSVDVLLSLDESSYSGGNMGGDHPIAWKHTVDSGRSFYTGLGHRTETFQDPLFQDHLLGGILWAANLAGPTAVPAWDQWGLIALGVLILGGGLFFIFRKG